MVNWKDYLPDFQGALTGFYEESLKNTVETKTQEFKELLQRNIAYGQATQQALVAIALGIFFLLLVTYLLENFDILTEERKNFLNSPQRR